jgi:hypothetical protein
MLRSRVAIGHLRGLVVILDCQLSLQNSPSTMPKPNLATQSTTSDPSTAAAAAAGILPTCSVAALWPAHDASCPVAGVFAVAALGPAGLITSAASHAATGGTSVSRRRVQITACPCFLAVWLRFLLEFGLLFDIHVQLSCHRQQQLLLLAAEASPAGEYSLAMHHIRSCQLLFWWCRHGVHVCWGCSMHALLRVTLPLPLVLAIVTNL